MCEALTIRVFKDDEQYQEVGIEQNFYLHLNQLCYPSTTNITGVAEYRSLNYLDSASHEPRIETEIVTFGSNCPVATNINAVIGFSHDKVNTRNLPIIYTSDSRDSNTDHCVGVKYKSTLEINLLDYVDNKFDKFTNNIYFKCNGIKVNGNIISNIEHPREFNPTFLYIELCYNEPAISLDSLWLTIYSPDDFDKYNNWIIEELNRGTNWLNTLPAVYEEMIDIGNLNANWNKTTPINPNSYMHHHATYESRSYPVEGKHGHQATYDSNGNLIRDGIAAGSADFFSPKGAFDEETELHRNIDVYPFIRAAQQDGNPVRPSNATDLLINIIPTRFSRPCIYQGQNLETYFKYRPALPSGTIPHTGENQ
jgi:hypothetical protein